MTGLGSPGLTLPPGLAGSGSATGAGAAPLRVTPRSATSGSTPRAGLRERLARRTRAPTAGLVLGPIRPTLIAQEVAANVQPAQTGLPDIAEPPAPPRRRPVLDDPYAPLGVRLGGLTLFPLIGQSIGYDTNPNRTQANRRGSFVSQTEGELRIQSGWSRHELTGSVRGAYNAYPDNPEASRPEGAGRLGFRYDVSRDTQVEADARYLIETQRPDSPDLNARVRERPVFTTAGASLGGVHRFNRLLVSVRGSIARTDYEDATLASGALFDQSDRNFTQYGGRARAGYELHPGFIPFAEAVVDTRQYDQQVDNSGFARSSDGFGGTIGTSFEITRLLTGEIAAGAIHRSYADPRLQGLTSPLANAALAYAFSPITTIRATAEAGVDETTVAGATGIRTLRGGLEVSHDLRRNLTLTAGLTAADFDYQGAAITEQSFGALLRIDWRLNRQVTVRASYNYERLESSIPGSDYTANVMLVGLRLQP